MNIRSLIFCSVVLISGCVSYAAVGPGELSYSGFAVQTGNAWNLVPTQWTTMSRQESRLLTQDGLLLDRISIIPAVPDGEPLFQQHSESEALPVFKSDMLPNEIEELTESSIVKLFGEGHGAVETANLRPHRFGDNRGMLFDLEVRVSDGPNYRGVAGAQIVDEKLYLIFFLGAEPYYYEKHIDTALEIIKSARVVAAS